VSVVEGAWKSSWSPSPTSLNRPFNSSPHADQKNVAPARALRNIGRSNVRQVRAVVHISVGLVFWGAAQGDASRVETRPCARRGRGLDARPPSAQLARVVGGLIERVKRPISNREKGGLADRMAIHGFRDRLRLQAVLEVQTVVFSNAYAFDQRKARGRIIPVDHALSRFGRPQSRRRVRVRG
jgi:hypothetical protein